MNKEKGWWGAGRKRERERERERERSLVVLPPDPI